MRPAPRPGTPPHPGRTGRNLGRVATVVAVLVGGNLTVHLTPLDAAVLFPAVVILVVLGLKVSGLGWRELGLAPDSWRPTAVWSAALVAVVAGGVTVALLVPPLRENLMSTRFTTFPGALLAALVTIPLVTVVPEELLFRGALDASLQRVLRPGPSLAAGALLFGLWHVLSSLTLTADSPGLAARVGTGAPGQAVGVVGAVAVTGAVGAGLLWLRRRTGSVLTPMALHWALNGLGAVGSALAWKLSA